MAYLYRRKRNLADLLIDRYNRRIVVIRDGTTSTGNYIVVINGQTFIASDTTGGADNSAALATSLAGSISSSTLPITATTSSNELILTPDIAGYNYSLEVATTDDDGEIFYRDAFAEAIKVKTASNWDGSFTTMETVPRLGKTSASVKPDPTPNGMLLDAYTRFRFDPVDYGLEDDDLLYFVFTPVYGGVDGSDSGIYIMLTPEQLSESHPAIILNGTAPSAADSDSALELILPAQTASLIVKNMDTTNDLYLSFGTGDGEIPLATGETFRDNRIGSFDIRIRGDGGTADVYVYAALNVQKIL